MRIFRKIKDFLIDIKCGVPNLIRWAPIVWKDRDWDFAYIDYIVIHKLERMYKIYSSHESMICDEEENEMAAQIKETLDLFKQSSEIEWWKTGNWEAEDQLRTQAYELIAKNSNRWWD